MALKQELLLKNRSDLHGPISIISEYDDATLKIIRFIVKGKDSNRKVSINIKNGLSTSAKEAKNADQDFSMVSDDLYFVKFENDGFEFPEGRKVVFSIGANK